MENFEWERNLAIYNDKRREQRFYCYQERYHTISGSFLLLRFFEHFVRRWCWRSCQADTNFSTSKIVVDDYNGEADIDLSLDYGSDGEISLNGDVGCYIDNSYEAGIGNLHVIPPPSTAPSGSAPVMATSVPAQPFTFQVQVPPNVSSGQQIQVTHPQTGQPLVVAVPTGVPPGGVFTVSA